MAEPQTKLSFSTAQLDEMKSRTPLSALIGTSVRLARQGREFTGLCPFHVEDTPSFTINDDKGFYHCFGCGAHGDHLDYLQERHGMTFPEAVRTLADGSSVTPEVQAATLPRSRQTETVWTPVLPVPTDVPPLVSAKGTAKVYNPKRAGTDKEWATLRPEMTHPYRDLGGTLLGYVLRCTFSDGGKFTPQVTWCANAAGEHRWCMIPFPEPRPLYGLDRLKPSKLSTVVIVEGEKCADTAQPFFNFPVLSWPGGANGVGHVDWTPLKGKKPLIWPDADAPGAKAAEGRWNERRSEVETGVAQLALAAGAVAVRVIQVPPDCC